MLSAAPSPSARGVCRVLRGSIERVPVISSGGARETILSLTAHTAQRPQPHATAQRERAERSQITLHRYEIEGETHRRTGEQDLTGREKTEGKGRGGNTRNQYTLRIPDPRGACI